MSLGLLMVEHSSTLVMNSTAWRQGDAALFGPSFRRLIYFAVLYILHVLYSFR